MLPNARRAQDAPMVFVKIPVLPLPAMMVRSVRKDVASATVVISPAVVKANAVYKAVVSPITVLVSSVPIIVFADKSIARQPALKAAP